jgi:hypothetical protein
MTTEASLFRTSKPTPWSGRYARIPGDKTVFHLKYVDGRMWPVIFWETDEGVGTCAACECDAAGQLADAVERAKRKAGGFSGGSFVINEYGQVLVPASDGSGRRYFAGELSGRLLFENPFDENDPIDLGDCKHLQPGDPWKLPYVGFPFNVNQRSNIYFYNVEEDGGESVFPRQQDRSLLASFRALRRTGAIRFIVNPFGVVLTKCPIQDNWSPEEQWQPFYIGTINKSLWFEKESAHA